MTEEVKRQSGNEQRLLKQLAELPREMAPEHDVWPRISGRIDRLERRSNRWWPQAVAASVLVAFVAGLMLGRQWDVPLVPEGAGPGNASRAEFAGTTDIAGSLVASEREYQAAFREFITVGRSRDSLPLETVEKIEIGWNDLREAEIALMTALRDNPDNLFLNAKMMDLRARQLEFLKQIAMLDRNSRRTTI
jgi:hypothetical protein